VEVRLLPPENRTVLIHLRLPMPHLGDFSEDATWPGMFWNAPESLIGIMGGNEVVLSDRPGSRGCVRREWSWYSGKALYEFGCVFIKDPHVRHPKAALG
jgi:hypothetical protein